MICANKTHFVNAFDEHIDIKFILSNYQLICLSIETIIHKLLFHTPQSDIKTVDSFYIIIEFRVNG